MGGRLSSAAVVLEGATLWRYSPENGCAIGIRTAPQVDAELADDEFLEVGDVFYVMEELEGADGVVFLRLADGRGWVFNQKPGVGTMCTRHQHAREALEEAQGRSEQRVGATAVRCRYHRLPKKLDDDYCVKPRKVLGSGANGDVVLGTSRYTKGKVAIKHLDLSTMDMQAREALITEVEIFLSMDHPHVARLLDVYETQDRLTLVMECLDGGDLFCRVKDQGKFKEAEAIEFVRQILLAVRYIHKRGVAHRDLKLENFMCESRDGNAIKLIDFGLGMFTDGHQSMDDCVGTLPYLAPEVLNKNYTSQCDMWSIGVITYILLSGKMPFRSTSEKQLLRDIRKANFSLEGGEWSEVSEVGRSFVLALMEPRPELRLTADEALHHPWLAGDVSIDPPALLEQCGGASSSSAAGFPPLATSSLIAFARAGPFRRSCWRLVAWSLVDCASSSKVASPGASPWDIAREAFLHLDTTGTGTISISDLKQALGGALPREVRLAVCKALAEFDETGKGEIRYSDFVAAMIAEAVCTDDLVMKDVCRRLSGGDRRGHVNAEGLQHVLGGVAGVEAAMAEMDWRCTGSVAPTEFVSFIRTAPEHGAASASAARTSAAATARAPTAGTVVWSAKAGNLRCGAWSKTTKRVAREVNRRARYLRVDGRRMLVLLPLLFTMAASSNSMLVQ
mmetsp:Transcript_99737/g.250038  ORF Transcript_99737/g.250038 Transcript_99737/m.250038 type:complete len:677 (-) Transcript_99737:100-2130(-)